jgi:DNA-binding transcriptional LysR family regulator
MELKQLEYMIRIAEQNNITKAAEQLFITQSALNQQLLKLEKELGTPLFVRSRSNWHLTEAGRIYIENARNILQIKKDTYNRINDLVEVQEGRLVIGLTPERGPEMFAAIYPLFYKKHPHITIEPLEMPVKAQQHAISQGTLDIGFLTLQEHQKTNDHHVHIRNESIILGVPHSHPLAYQGGKLGEPLPSISLKEFGSDSFAIMPAGTTLREIYDQLIQAEGINPPVLLETRSCNTLFELVREGICCSIFPMYYAKPSSNVSYFTLDQNIEWQICASYRKNTYLRRAAKDLIEIAIEYWEKKR